MVDEVLRISRTSQQSIYHTSVKCFFVFYILVGLPTGFQGRFLPIYFRRHGMSLTRVGLYRLLVFPWLLKGLWMVFLDRKTDVRVWLNTSLLALSLVCIAAAHVEPTSTIFVALVLFLLNTITAIQDTSIDTLLMDAFTPSQLLIGNVAQAVGERFGAVISGGLFGWYIDYLNWAKVFYIMAGLYAFGLLTAFFWLPDWHEGGRRPSAAQPDSKREPVSGVLRSSISDTMALLSKSSLWMTIFVLFYKIGEVGVFTLFPLFLIDQGIEAADIGLWLGIVGQSAAVAGSVATAFFTIRSLILPLKILMIIRGFCISISLAAVLFWNTNPELYFVCGVASLIVTALTGGALTTCTQTLLMQLSQRAARDERAKHYALYSFGELLAKLLFAAVVTALAQVTSYEFTFSLFAVAATAMIPYMWLAPTHVDIEMEQ